jgi:all-trans-8'-apo-beta-carotenal 15,15'-oxygenase
MEVAVPLVNTSAGAGDPYRIFDSLRDEHDYPIDETRGALPDGLRGTLYRNGPGRFEVGDQPWGHLFDGDGMLSMFAIDGKQVRYRNRYVRTSHYLGSAGSRSVKQRGFGTLKPGGVFANALRGPANVANTSVVLHAGELLALWEGSHPHALDPDTLDTRGVQSFDGALRWLGAFSAHPKIDPDTGDLYNFGFQMLPRPMLRCYRLDPRGQLHHLRDVALPAAVVNHDFALTKRHLVFVIDPIVIDLMRVPAVLFGLKSYDRAVRFRAQEGTTVVLVPRDGSKPTVTQTDALMHFHVNNAYEDGEETVVEIVRWDLDWGELDPYLREFRTAHQIDAGGYLTRLHINPGGRVLHEQVSDALGEFPQFDRRLTGRRHRYSYIAARDADCRASKAIVTNAIVKHDHLTGLEQVHTFPDGHAISEPIFVPRGIDAAEDDGWLLAVGYDSAEHRSHLVVLDAQSLEREPLYIGHLRHHLPQSFHGTFTPRVAKPDRVKR